MYFISFHQDLGQDSIQRFDATRYARGSTTVADLKENMQRTMQKFCGVFRTCSILQRGCREMTRLYTCQLPEVKVCWFYYLTMTWLLDDGDDDDNDVL